jgi:hypothetical protein
MRLCSSPIATPQIDTSSREITTPQQVAIRSVLPFVTRVLVAAVLLIAAIAKLTASKPVDAGAVPVLSWVSTILIPIELFIGLWLLSGAHLRTACGFGVLLFIAFAGFSFANIAKGATRCDCFGRSSFAPWISLTIDIIALAMLTLCAQLQAPSAPSRAIVQPNYVVPARMLVRYRTRITCLLAGFGVALATPAHVDLFNAKEHTIILEPDMWVGKSCPVLSRIDIGQELSHGPRTLIFYHHDCSICRDFLRRYKPPVAGIPAISSDRQTTTLVEMPPYGDSIVPSCYTEYLSARMSDDADWFMPTPLVVRLEDGIVTEVEHN